MTYLASEWKDSSLASGLWALGQDNGENAFLGGAELRIPCSPAGLTQVLEGGANGAPSLHFPLTVASWLPCSCQLTGRFNTFFA